MTKAPIGRRQKAQHWQHGHPAWFDWIREPPDEGPDQTALTAVVRARQSRRLFLAVAVGMLPWVAFLGVTLPPRYDAGHWNLLWVGFDIALVCVLGYAAWAAWFRRQILASTSLIAGTLLLCDAWFDVITSIGHHDQWLTVLTAVAGELPLAVFFFWLYRRIVLTTLASFHELLGDGPSPRRLHEAQIFSLPTRPPLVATNPCDANLGHGAFSAGSPTAWGENGSSG